MTENKYNIRIREAISDRYIECSKLRKQTFDKFIEVSRKLQEEKSTISYQDYTDLLKYADKLQYEVQNLTVELETWDKAREVCLDVIDEGGNI